ncbi:4-hydroxy-tetrahydrodipicolinate reductase [Hydrogenimonas sp.]|uniref:4-hydroxy-tetrahydrodipicolinate reductase n=1 Tax=Hydrogenimonas sp. TaxID=2231112 RepID=UPI0026267E88|nr:4-hydroxy-tetrahydrodipicolinate reductase [Hydrogenimonas sp.]
MLKVGVYGANGRVGQLLVKNLSDDPETEVAALCERDRIDFHAPEGSVVTNDAKIFLDSCEAAIDFTVPEATEALLRAAMDRPRPLVIGTTGLDDAQKALLEEASETMPILYATNMSAGIALLKKLVQLTAEKLGDFDIEIVEQHHRFKKDAPSGTALTLAEFAANGRGLDLDRVRVSCRDGMTGERTKEEIGVMAIRGGDVVGRHTVGFYNDGEFIELNHTATSRETFSKGAVRACKWLADQPAGLYDISDCLGL